MKLSLNWLKKYLNIAYTPEKIAEMLTIIGLEVEGIEKVESIKGGLTGVITGEVVSCEKHPDADRLSITNVNIGQEDLLQIVCGAPNVAKGQKVMVATIGTQLYDKEGQPFTIKKGKIRGVESQGMICAEDELGIGNDHSGITVLPSETPIALPAAQYYKLEDDFVFEVGLTPNRSDATSQLGVARDLLAYLRVNEKYAEEIIEPDISGFITERVGLNIDVEVEDKEACIRYTGITINNIAVKESPDWLKKLLKSIGVKPINNIVDVTNFVLHELGQPLHAFDADKISNKKIVVKRLQSNTEFLSLDGVTRKLHEDDLMICDMESRPLCMAGVYGGFDSGVSSSTKNIFIESACFQSKSIRKTSTRHNLRTDAAKIFEKGADPNITEFALKRASSLIRELAGGAVSNTIIDVYPKVIKEAEVRLYYDKVNNLIGTEIPEDDVHAILQAMDMEITPLDEDSILVRIPTNKSDVTREVDLIEEIVRIYGLNRVPVPSQIKSTISYTVKPDKYQVKELLSDFLASNGFNEMMGLSLIESRHYNGLNIADENDFVYINNTSNIHLDIMRPDMLVSGLVSVSYNLNRQQTNLSLFEFGKSYKKRDKAYQEDEWLTVFMTGKKNEESWLSDNKREKSFFDIKSVVFSILAKVGINQYQVSEVEDSPEYNYGLRIHRGPLVIAEFGEIKKSVCQKMGVKPVVYFGKIAFNVLLSLAGKVKTEVAEISRFPSVRRDLALVIDKKVKFSEIETIARQTDKKLLKQISLFDVYENEQQMGKDKKSYAVSFVFQNEQKTLNDTEIDEIMSRLTKQLEEKTQAIIRK
ncbi:MAG: phenylalanine--tRNA ligase subunit beta [Saprospiraceae bacterium]|nr:phenylalanine--tRNA ligase subunit beta [Saprospiraceae bacterium]